MDPRDETLVLRPNGGVDLLASFDVMARDFKTAPNPPSDESIGATHDWLARVLKQAETSTRYQNMPKRAAHRLLQELATVLATAQAMVDTLNEKPIDDPSGIAALLAAIVAARRDAGNDEGATTLH